MDPYDTSPSPPQTIPTGARVVVEGDIGDYDGAGYIASGSAAGVVVAYATPELKLKQNWAEESYYVRLDGETGNRVFSRDRLIVVDRSVSRNRSDG